MFYFFFTVFALVTLTMGCVELNEEFYSGARGAHVNQVKGNANYSQRRRVGRFGSKEGFEVQRCL